MESKATLRVILIIVGLTILLSIPRFKHYVAPDSSRYVDLASYFQGSLPKQELQAPFAYRVLVPYLSSLGPTNTLDLNITLINVLFTSAAFIVFFFYLQALIKNKSQLYFGMLLLVVAFPTVNYSSGVMTDAAGFFFFVLSSYFFLKKRFLFFTIALCIGVMAREAILVLLLALLVYLLVSYFRGPKGEWNPKLLLVFIPPILMYLGIRTYFSDIPSFFWFPNLEQFLFTVSRPVAWTTFGLTLLPPLILILLAYRQQSAPVSDVLAIWSFHEKALLFSLTVAGIALNIYSISSAALSGRFVWPFYLVLVPLAAAFYRKDSSRLFTMIDTLSSRVFANRS